MSKWKGGKAMVCRNAQVRRRRRWSVWMLATAGWVRLRMGSCVIAVVRLGGCSSFVNEGLASLAYIPRLLAGGSCSSAVFVRYGSSAKAGDSRQALLDGQRVPPPLFFGVGGGGVAVFFHRGTKLGVLFAGNLQTPRAPEAAAFPAKVRHARCLTLFPNARYSNSFCLMENVVRPEISVWPCFFWSATSVPGK